jgi:class 3 adenylate cyclase/YHS domain-containing protein
MERTIAFVDLAGFTALTEVHGDAAALDLVDAFTSVANRAVADVDAEIVKTIGDAVMVAAAGPAPGLEAVRRLFEACYAAPAFPDPRAGLHHGPVLPRDGDFFGATVNLAARVASRAGSGQVVATAVVAAEARAQRIDTVDLGEQRLRNVLDLVPLWAVELTPGHVDLSIDPVCRMRIGCQGAVARVRHAGAEHWLCSLDCLRAFAVDPDRYVLTEVDTR